MTCNQQALKNLVWFALVLALLATVYGVIIAANAYSNSIQPGNYRSFTVNGEGKVTAKNDIAQFTYSVTIEGAKDITALKKQSDDKTSKIQAFLKAQGVDQADVQTVAYNLSPRYQNTVCASNHVGACQNQELVGYTLSQTDSIKIRDLSKADQIVSGVVAAGANEVSQLTFTVDDSSALQTQAKGLAVKQALKRAQALAAVGGFKVGRIISIDENNVYTPRATTYGLGMMVKEASMDAMSLSSVNPGSNDITSDVTVRFELK